MFFSSSREQAVRQCLERYQLLEYTICHLTGCNLEQLRDLFAKGYMLTPPEPTATLMAELAKQLELIDESV